MQKVTLINNIEGTTFYFIQCSPPITSPNGLFRKGLKK